MSPEVNTKSQERRIESSSYVRVMRGPYRATNEYANIGATKSEVERVESFYAPNFMHVIAEFCTYARPAPRTLSCIFAVVFIALWLITMPAGTPQIIVSGAIISSVVFVSLFVVERLGAMHAYWSERRFDDAKDRFVAELLNADKIVSLNYLGDGYESSTLHAIERSRSSIIEYCEVLGRQCPETVDDLYQNVMEAIKEALLHPIPKPLDEDILDRSQNSFVDALILKHKSAREVALEKRDKFDLVFATLRNEEVALRAESMIKKDFI